MIDTSKRFVVVTNHRASALLNERGESRLHKQVLEPLSGFNKKIIELTMPQTEELYDALEEGDTLIACGGDGTANWLMNVLHHKEIAEHVTLVPQPFGGANDIAEGLYGRLRLERIIQSGTPSTAHAISATIEHDSHPSAVAHGIGYIGIGASGNAAEAINTDRDHMKRTQVIKRAGQAVLQSQSFMYLDEQNVPRRGFEILALNGRMSYVIQPYRPHYFERAHQQVIASQRANAIGKIGLSIFRLVKGSLVVDDDTVSVTPLQDVLLQTDGEAQIISTGSIITISNGPTIRLARVRR